ncbi:iron permease [Athelia psychrophila]|uniref:Iron permease n=1 Tax=Athelia psychrophila TaxID=1759441 RepID=A0A166PPB7_9AGAM|nr:iron permease [Fibularhizoctonia sp. CBS 109695]
MSDVQSISTPKAPPPVSADEEEAEKITYSLNFWLVICANLSCDFLSAFDLSVLSTALPTIVHDLNGTDFIWAATAYTLAGTAATPLVGGLSTVFGRKPILLLALLFFAIGAAVCGSAQNMRMLVLGRVIQGFGGGLCESSVEVVYNDLIPVSERGRFTGLMASVWALAFAVGPIIGGAAAEAGAWRWIFFLNLPICAIAATTVFFFLKVRTPTEPFGPGIMHMDWLGVALVVGSSGCIILAFTWAGVPYGWSSPQVVIPLVLGFVGIIAFGFVEKFYSKEPTVPWKVIGNRTSISGYLGTFFHGICSICVIYYLPVYFQAAKGSDTLQSSVNMLSITLLVAPVAIVTGVSVEILNRYRPQNRIGWVLIVLAFGLFTLLDAHSHRGLYVGVQAVMGLGLGTMWVTPQFAVLSPLPESNNAYANSFWLFTRYFANSWGVAIGGCVLQNQLRARLPVAFTSSLPAGTQLAYAAIPKINALPEALRNEVRRAFAESMRTIWYVMLGVAILGLGSTALMREVAMKNTIDAQWGLQDGHETDAEKTVGSAGGSTVTPSARHSECKSEEWR